MRTQSSFQAETAPPRILRRSWRDRMIAGVCGGLAAYLKVDSLLVRIAAVIFLVAEPGLAVFGYLVAACLIPREPHSVPDENSPRETLVINGSPTVLGVLLVAGGVLIAVTHLLPWIETPLIAAGALVALGIFLLRPRGN